MKGHYVRHGYGMSVLERFMLHVKKQENGCWDWTASLKMSAKNGGYGQFKFRGVMERAHRVSWILHRGEIPAGMCVLHICIGNGLCVNPDHLYLGTREQNAKDRKEQGRNADKRGEANGRATVTEEIVKQIRAMRPPRLRLWTPSYKFIADKFKVSVQIVKNIVNGYTWKHVKLDNPSPIVDKPNSE